MHTYISLQGVCGSSQGFLFWGLSGIFVWKVSSGVVFVHPLLSEYIHDNRKLNITFNFRFHMYEFFLKYDVTCSWASPPSVTNCHTFSEPLPSSVTYFMDGPWQKVVARFLPYLH